jgi:uncharacterized membrane protein YoaK (UPF0700 family)
MTAENLATLSVEELRARLAKAKTLQRTVWIIFSLIILAWIVLGFWRENTPVFIINVVLAVAVSAITSAPRRALEQELAKR